MKNIGIIGQGFVGSAIRLGMEPYFNVLAYDKDPNKFSNVSSITDIVNSTDMAFLCVPTPMFQHGQCDLSIVKNALSEINEAAENKGDFVVILKSTVPPGTTEQLNNLFSNLIIVFNPEFLTELNANKDYVNQNRIIIGGSIEVTSVVEEMFKVAFPDIPILKTSSDIAEVVKYVTNTFLAMKVSFANEIHQFCNSIGVDYNSVIECAKYDERLGQSHWVVPGPDGELGFGGSCFPKDVNALIYEMSEVGVNPTMLKATWDKNLEVRPGKDWEKLKGRAVSSTDVNNSL
jgi:UDPglucose 6-dehydrogenase